MFANILHRPALAIVISVLILFLGTLAINTLPISQFPSVAPPSVVVSVSYPGASAEVLVDSVLIILEQAINGVQDMRYMASAATSAGEGAIQIIFEPGTDPNVAVLNVNNRIQIVKNRLPPIVEREGIIVMQNMTSMLMYVNIYSTDKGLDQNFLYNYVMVNILPEIRRTRGVGTANILGNRAYAMRIMLNIDRMRAYKVSADEVMKAVAEQSMIGSPGRLGQATGKTSQTVEYVLTWVGRYNKPEQYENIILKANPDGEILRIKDIAKVELGSSFYDLYSDIDGNPSAAIVLKQLPGTNAATIIEQVKEKLKEFKADLFPPGMDYEVSYDVSAFLEASIEKVLHTLFEAFVLVALVVFLFLGDWRSTLIPTLAVPVSLIGTFFFMLLFGLSINLITLFALVLAIGVVVDDAIVVVEAVHAKMAEKHLSPYRATKEVMQEISGAIIAITMVMTAVFVPVTFMTGPVGVFYRQFGLTMAMSIVLSGIVALTLTPVLCAMLLKPHTAHVGWRGPLAMLLHLFDRGVEKVTGGYAAVLRRIVTRRALTMLVDHGLRLRHLPREHAALVRLHPARGPGHDLRDHPDAPGLDPRVHQRQVPRAPGDRPKDRRRQVGLLAGRLRGPDRGPRLERRHLPHQPEELVRPQDDLAPDHRAARGEGQRDLQRQARVLRAARGPRLRCGRRLLHTCSRQDQHDELPRARKSDRQVHGRVVEAQGGQGPVHLLRQQLPAV